MFALVREGTDVSCFNGAATVVRADIRQPLCMSPSMPLRIDAAVSCLGLRCVHTALLGANKALKIDNIGQLVGLRYSETLSNKADQGV